MNFRSRHGWYRRLTVRCSKAKRLCRLRCLRMGGVGDEFRRTAVIFCRKSGSESRSLEALQPSFDHPSVVFEPASEDPVQTSNCAPANSEEKRIFNLNLSRISRFLSVVVQDNELFPVFSFIKFFSAFMRLLFLPFKKKTMTWKTKS